MPSIIGVDSRLFVRNPLKKDGTKGHFSSVLGIAVKIRDYESYNIKYQEAMKKAFLEIGLEPDYQYYCVNDFRDMGMDNKKTLLQKFLREISPHIEKVHVFYTLFSKKQISEVKVYGRMAKNEKIKLSSPTRTYEQLVSGHLVQCFPAICAWKLTEYLRNDTVQFHLDAYQGHIFEAQEDLETKGYTYTIFPSGDCINPVISTADLLLEVLDERLASQNRLLIFDNIRPSLLEFGENVLVYPILSKHLQKITPLDKKPIDIMPNIKHPVFWVFKGEELLDTGTFRRSKTYRNLLDLVVGFGGVAKMFEKSKDIDSFQKGDYGVYLNGRGKEIVESYIKIGKDFKLFDLTAMVPKKAKKDRKI